MKQSDIENCALTLIKAFKEEPWNENWTYEQAYTRIDEIMSARVSRGYVIYDGDTVVSMLCGRIMTYLGFKELWVDEFSVHPDYQRQGIGTKMIEFVRMQLKEETEKISYIVLTQRKVILVLNFMKQMVLKPMSHWCLWQRMYRKNE